MHAACLTSGRVAQLGERGVRNAEVEGSNPFASTRTTVSKPTRNSCLSLGSGPSLTRLADTGLENVGAVYATLFDVLTTYGARRGEAGAGPFTMTWLGKSTFLVQVA